MCQNWLCFTSSDTYSVFSIYATVCLISLILKVWSYKQKQISEKKSINFDDFQRKYSNLEFRCFLVHKDFLTCWKRTGSLFCDYLTSETALLLRVSGNFYFMWCEGQTPKHQPAWWEGRRSEHNIPSQKLEWRLQETWTSHPASSLVTGLSSRTSCTWCYQACCSLWNTGFICFLCPFIYFVDSPFVACSMPSSTFSSSLFGEISSTRFCTFKYSGSLHLPTSV